MGLSRRTFGELAEWIWEPKRLKWRTFGEAAEWIWGSACFGALNAPKVQEISLTLASESPKTLTISARCTLVAGEVPQIFSTLQSPSIFIFR